MKRTFIAWAVVMGLGLFIVPKAAALTLEDVVNMSNIGVADSVIISAIEASGTVFHLTANDIIELTRAGVSQAVIEALQKTARKESSAQQGAESRPGPAPAVAPEPVPQPAPTPKPPPASSTKTTRPASPRGSLSGSRPRSQPLPADVKQLKRRYDTGKYTSAAAMAYDLLTGPNKDRYAAVRSTIYYYLGKSLYKLGFYHSAHTIFLRVAQEGPSSPHYNGCLSLLTRTSDILKEYDGFMSVLEGVSTADLPRRVRSTLLYLIGLNQYLNEDFSDARNTLDGVSVNSRFYAKAQFITGMALFRMQENRKAVRTFRELVEGRQLVGEPEEIRDIQDLAVLNMARIYYKVQDFDRAELLYDLVPRDSRYWPQALYEMAYANFWQSDYNVSLGLLLTLHSPFFAGKTYLPEADILEALVYFNLCEYDRVERIVKAYQAYTKSVRDSIRTFRKTFGLVIQGDMAAFHRDARAMEAAMRAYSDVYRSEPPGRALGIPREVMASV